MQRNSLSGACGFYRYLFYRHYRLWQRTSKLVDDRPWPHTVAAFSAWICIDTWAVLTIISEWFNIDVKISEGVGTLMLVGLCILNYFLLVHRGVLEKGLEELSSIPKSTVKDLLFYLYLASLPLLVAASLMVIAINRVELPKGI